MISYSINQPEQVNIFCKQIFDWQNMVDYPDWWSWRMYKTVSFLFDQMNKITIDIDFLSEALVDINPVDVEFFSFRSIIALKNLLDRLDFFIRTKHFFHNLMIG